jgi:hypothetical protein
MHTVLSVGPISSVLYNPHSNSFRLFALSLGFSIQVHSTDLFGWIYKKLHIAIKIKESCSVSMASIQEIILSKYFNQIGCM